MPRRGSLSRRASIGVRGRWRSRSQGPELDVAKPAVAAVILQADISPARVVLVGDVELVLRAVGAPIRLGPVVQVHARDDLAVEFHLDQAPVAGDPNVIP